MTRTLVLGSSGAEVRGLAVALSADLVEVELAGANPWVDPSELETWRALVAAGEPCSAIVVAIWPASQVPSALIDTSLDDFGRRAEWPIATWCAALGAASVRCADGGIIVAVTERPSPLDSAGWAAEAGVADAVEALARSLAKSEGPRGVCVNVVSTPCRLAPEHPVAPAVPLASYPGRIEHEVASAVAMMLGSGIAGVTGTVVHVDGGRSWR